MTININCSHIFSIVFCSRLFYVHVDSSVNVHWIRLAIKFPKPNCLFTSFLLLLLLPLLHHYGNRTAKTTQLSHLCWPTTNEPANKQKYLWFFMIKYNYNFNGLYSGGVRVFVLCSLHFFVAFVVDFISRSLACLVLSIIFHLYCNTTAIFLINQTLA